MWISIKFVRFTKPYNYTPTKNPVTTSVVAGFLIGVMGFERPLRKHAGGMFLGRGRILWFLDAPLAGVDRNQIYTILDPDHTPQTKPHELVQQKTNHDFFL